MTKPDPTPKKSPWWDLTLWPKPKPKPKPKKPWWYL